MLHVLVFGALVTSADEYGWRAVWLNEDTTVHVSNGQCIKTQNWFTCAGESVAYASDGTRWSHGNVRLPANTWNFVSEFEPTDAEFHMQPTQAQQHGVFGHEWSIYPSIQTLVLAITKNNITFTGANSIVTAMIAGQPRGQARATSVETIEYVFFELSVFGHPSDADSKVHFIVADDATSVGRMCVDAVPFEPGGVTGHMFQPLWLRA